MQMSHFSLVGLVGTLVFLAGAHLLWKNREAAISWLREFVRILRADFARKSSGQRGSAAAGWRGTDSRGPRSGALVLAGAVALILLGQILFLLDLTY